MSRRILVAIISCSVIAAACVDDISSTSGDTLTAAELASRSSAQYGLFNTGFWMTRGYGMRLVPMLLPGQPLPGPPYTLYGTTSCPAGGITTTRAIIDHLQDGQRIVANATQKATDCAVTVDDSTTWTFESSGLKWTGAWIAQWSSSGHSFALTVTGPMSWSGAGKRGGCRVNLTVRQFGVLWWHDTITVQGQACGARVNVKVEGPWVLPGYDPTLNGAGTTRTPPSPSALPHSARRN